MTSEGATQSIGVLNRLLGVHCQSLPTYLCSTVIWGERNDRRAADTLTQIAADQKYIADRIIGLIDRRQGQFNRGQTRDLTWLNDLSIDFLIKQTLDYQVRDAADIASCVEFLSADPEAKAIAEEALGMAKAHLESLEEVAGERRPS